MPGFYCEEVGISVMLLADWRAENTAGRPDEPPGEPNVISAGWPGVNNQPRFRLTLPGTSYRLQQVCRKSIGWRLAMQVRNCQQLWSAITARLVIIRQFTVHGTVGESRRMADYRFRRRKEVARGVVMSCLADYDGTLSGCMNYSAA